MQKCTLLLSVFCMCQAGLIVLQYFLAKGPSLVLKENKFEVLLRDYQDLVQVWKDKEFWRENVAVRPCDDTKRELNICFDTQCNVSVIDNPPDNLRSILTSARTLDHGHLEEIRSLLVPQLPYADVVFVTAASHNHYAESQALLKNLNQYAFPFIRNYTLVYYDLGLTEEERRQVIKYCRCQLITFPIHLLPTNIQPLNCYVWKPLLVHGAVSVADKVIWVDASVRFKNATILDVINKVDQRHIIAHADFRQPVAYHTQLGMLEYFGEHTCSLTAVQSVAAAFLGFKNTRFIKEVVLLPWVACALTWDCMCVVNPSSHRRCYPKIRKYNKCHRFDQSAISIIFAKLFRGHDVSVHLTSAVVLRRGDRAEYFKELELEEGYTNPK